MRISGPGVFFAGREIRISIAALEEHLRSVVDPGVQIEVHGTRKGGLGEQFRFFQAIDTPDILENILKCRSAAGDQAYDAFVSLNSTDPALYEAREVLDIPVLGFLETTTLAACMMGRTFSLITPNPKFSISYTQKLELYGLTSGSRLIEAMDVPHFRLPECLSGLRRARARHAGIRQRSAARGGGAVEVIIPCGSHAVLQARWAMREIEGASSWMALGSPHQVGGNGCEAAEDHGTFVSRKLLYQIARRSGAASASRTMGFDLG